MLQRGDPARYADVLLAACVENLQFDRQCEENRAEYMIRLLKIARLETEARGAILRALPTSEEGRDRDWTIDLLEVLAKEGDETAWSTLRDLAAGGNERAEDNLATTDDAGLTWVTEYVLPRLPDDERYRIGFWLPDEESNDRTDLQRRLRVLVSEWEAECETTRRQRPPPKPSTRTFLQRLDAGKGEYAGAFDFAHEASPRLWRAAARRFLRENRARPLRVYASLCRHRPWPLSLAPLFRHAMHPLRGRVVRRVLGTLDSPAVRRFGLGLLRRRPLPWDALRILRSSLRPGDEPAILTALVSVERGDVGTRHDPALDAVDLFRKHPSLAWQSSAEWIFLHSPCSLCRSSAVNWMAEHGHLPEWIVEEAPYDAEPEIRKAILKS